MNKLFSNIRFYVLFCSIALATVIYAWVALTIPESSLRTIKLTQTYALLALTYLYITLLISPIYEAIPNLPYKSQVHKARRGLGVSVFFFALLHAYNAFFNQLGGFAGLGFLSSTYIQAILLSFTALCILTVMASTSFGFMVTWLGYKNWKSLHRMVYVAGILILLHALKLGGHFASAASISYRILLFATVILISLEALRVDRWMMQRTNYWQRNWITLCAIVISVITVAYIDVETEKSTLFNIHSHHVPSSEGMVP